MGEISFQNPAGEIDSAFNDATIASKRQIGEQAIGDASGLSQQIAGMGGEAFQTGAAKGGFNDIFLKANRDISNVVMGYAVQKEQMRLQSDQFLQNLTAQGILDPKTGAFLKSTFSQQLELEDVRFAHQMTLAQKQAEAQGTNSLFQGLGTLAGYAFFGPMGGMAGGMLGGAAGKAVPGAGVSGQLNSYNPKVTVN